MGAWLNEALQQTDETNESGRGKQTQTIEGPGESKSSKYDLEYGDNHGS
jgi:hypothetical protein